METKLALGDLQAAASQTCRATTGVWCWLKETLDLSAHQPEAAPEAVISELQGREGRYYVLKNPMTRTYYRLSDRDHFLWKRMDGSHTVRELVVSYFMEYGAFAFGRVATLIQGLKAAHMLTDRPVNVYQHVGARLKAREPAGRAFRLSSIFFEKQFAVSGIDHWVGAAYRWGGRLIYTRPFQALCLLISIAGLYAFARVFNAGDYGVVTIAGSYRLGVAGLILAGLLSILVHEMAHALTVKHYGCEVRRGGFMLFYGMPAFFVDTTDIWMKGKRARLAVTWAGPYSGLILGGLACLIMLAWPALPLNALLFQFAFLSYITVFFNLNPLLQLDGYYLLMDSLEIPMLRRKSLEFISADLWKKIKGFGGSELSPRKVIGKFSREEKIFTVFGLLSTGWTAYAIGAGAHFWQQQLGASLQSLWRQGGDVGKIILSALGLAISLPFVLAVAFYLLSLTRKLVGWFIRRGIFANPWTMTAALVIAVLTLYVASVRLDNRLLDTTICVVTLGAGAILAWRLALSDAGSRFSTVWRLLAICLLSLMLGEVSGPLADLVLPNSALVRIAGAGLFHLAFAILLAIGLWLVSHIDFGALHPREKTVMLVGLLGSYVLAFWMAATRLDALTLPGGLLNLLDPLVALLVLSMLVPSVVSFWYTRSGPAWLVLILGIAGLAITGQLGTTPLLPYLLLTIVVTSQTLSRTQAAISYPHMPTSLDVSDTGRLHRAFSWIAAGLFKEFSESAGARATRTLEGDFNNHALAAGWRVSIVDGQPNDTLSSDLSLAQRGRVYGAALTLLLDLGMAELGKRTTVRALQRAYDGLCWEEREIGARYMFPDVEQASALSRDFQHTTQRYRFLLRRMPVIAGMDDAEIDQLLPLLKEEQYGAGKTILRQGEPGDRFFIVERGHVLVTARNEEGVTEVVNRLDRGDFFGEVALLRDAPRNATCRATVSTVLLSLSRHDFDILVRGHFALREKLDHSVVRLELLRNVPLFAELDAQQIALLAAQLEEQEFQTGDMIMRQGEVGETFYIIESGRVKASSSEDGEERVVAERGPGEYVGEIALLLDAPRTATITALELTRTFSLGKSDFDRLLARHLFVSRGLELDASRRMGDLARTSVAV